MGVILVVISKAVGNRGVYKQRRDVIKLAQALARRTGRDKKAEGRPVWRALP